MTVRELLLPACGRISRRLHSDGLIWGKQSGAIRLLAGKVASQGDYAYRNHEGHVQEADMSDYMERIGFFGAHSAHLIRYLSNCLRPGDWAIDVGANVGLISSPMSAAVGPKGCVWAIEPLPRNIERLSALKSRNNLVQLEVFPLAASAATSTERLRLSSLPGGSGSGSFVAPWALPEYVEVRSVALDDLIEDQGPSQGLRLLKIDVEGYEAQVVAGAQRTLKAMRPIVLCEFHDVLLRAAGSSSESLLDLFAELGYAPRRPFGLPRGSLDGKVVDMLLSTRQDLLP